jgi:hypothetical protein
MDGFYTQELNAFGAEPHNLWGSFAPNGTSDPLTASNGGPIRAFTTVYAATGQYTVTLPAGLVLPGVPTVIVSAQAADLAGYFEVMTIGAFNAATRSFVVQAKRASAGQAVAAAAGARIHFLLCFNNSTGV